MGAYPTINLNDEVPAAPANSKNVTFQAATSVHGITVENVTAYVKQFGASGTSHDLGLVPDPGASAGSTRFLREDGSWSVPSGGGSGIPSGSNVVIGMPRQSTDTGYSGLSIIKKMSACELINLASAWKFSLSFVTGAAYTANGVIYRTLIDDTTIVDATVVEWSSSPTVSFVAGEIFSDALALPLDTAHDYWIVVYMQTGSGAINVGNGAQLLPFDVTTGYITGDKTGLTTGGTVPSGINPEETIYRVISD